MKMLADHILVKPYRWPLLKQGSIDMPEMSEVQKQLGLGTVVSVGPGRCTILAAEHSPPDVAVGDRVLYYKQHSMPLLLNGEELLDLREDGLVAILEPHEYPDDKKDVEPELKILTDED